jgi:hypothetical protein
MFGCLMSSSAPPMALMLTERTLFFHDIVDSTDKPSGLLNVKLWTTGIAKPRQTRARSLTFGPGSKDMSSLASPHSRATSVSSTTAPSARTYTIPTASHSESEPSVVRTFGGLEDENDSLEELQSVLGKRGSSVVCASILAAMTDSQLSVPLPDGSQS